LPSRWWCSSWSVSAGMFFFGLFCGGIVSCFSADTRWAPMLGGNRKLGYDPRTQEENVGKRSSQNRDDARGDKGSPRSHSYLKSCEYFYMCPRAPFYRETNGLLHSENTLRPKEYS
jgi:hypothetical protein